MKLKISAVLVAGCFLCTSALAADLMAIYRDAQAQDPVYSSARYSFEASKEIVPQARATNLLPSIGLTSTFNRNHRKTEGFPAADFNTSGVTVSLTQPLFRMQTAKQGYLRLGVEPVLDLPLDTADPMRFEPVDFGVTNPAIVFLD